MVRSKCQAGDSENWYCHGQPLWYQADEWERLVLPWTSFAVCTIEPLMKANPTPLKDLQFCLGNVENQEIESDSLNWTVYCTVYQI
jgi:hypothetical protein